MNRSIQVTAALAVMSPLLFAAAPVNAAGADLSASCPSPFIVQLDWFPQAEHGYLFNVLGDGYKIDTKNMTARSKLVAEGKDTGIEIELRSGGAPIAGMGTNKVMYTDPAIHMAVLSHYDLALGYRVAPMISVLAPFEKNPVGIMWDPQTYPDVKTIKDLKDKNIVVNVSPYASYPKYLVTLGQLSEAQIDRSFDSSPARFIASKGKIAQQALATVDPYNYTKIYTEWGKPIKYQLIDDAGFHAYFETLAIRSADLEKLQPCLKLLIPLLQRSAVDYIKHPEAANEKIVDMVKKINSYWRYPMDKAAYSAKAQLDLGMVSNGSDTTFGNFDKKVVDGMMDILRRSGERLPDDLTSDKTYTNEFIDKSIGLN
ncbi:hypothetical protein [Mesorhizobium koreense]|jgi:hypothetical protein|uniref:hypothetical protein n=1 Tax=Mesorhizobium koreense TaxID=3074855 RepID=UPI00287B7C9B|nr:hypothetical protein [Mesorhizobium sp. WR6]